VELYSVLTVFDSVVDLGLVQWDMVCSVQTFVERLLLKLGQLVFQ
jgi:hypothetical protein